MKDQAERFYCSQQQQPIFQTTVLPVPDVARL